MSGDRLSEVIGSPKRPNHVVCTDEQKLHTEAIRSDEVTHAAEVQNSAKSHYRNSRCSRDRQKDIRFTEGGLCQKKKKAEKSAEAIVLMETSGEG